MAGEPPERLPFGFPAEFFERLDRRMAENEARNVRVHAAIDARLAERRRNSRPAVPSSKEPERGS